MYEKETLHWKRDVVSKLTESESPSALGVGKSGKGNLLRSPDHDGLVLRHLLCMSRMSRFRRGRKRWRYVGGKKGIVSR
jgi:hypothetical protein